VKLIQKIQFEILRLCSKIIKKNHNSNSLFCYFAFWDDTIGFKNILFQLNKKNNFLKLVLKIFKEIYFSSIDIKFSIKKNSKNKINNYKKIIFTDASLADFDSYGNFTDRYFRSNPKKNKQYLYFVIYSSKKFPKKISENLILLKYEYLFFRKYHFLKNFIVIIKNLYKCNFNFIKLINQHSLTAKFAKNIIKYIEKELNLKKFEKLLISFEAQPYQIDILNIFKKSNKKIVNIGYDHSTPHALPIHMFYRFKNLDHLIVNGINQKKFFIKYLKWPSNKINVEKSLRYQLNDNLDYSGKIFLPFKIFNVEMILYEFDFILSLKPYLAKNLTIRNHPLKFNSPNHIFLINSLKSIINKYVKKNKKYLDRKNNISFFIGQTTSVIVALEKNLNVIHICNNPNFDMYNSKLWNNLKVAKISNNSFEYKLLKKNSFLNFVNNSKSKIIKSYECD